MFDMQGNVIGINSQILSPTGGNVGIGFAIPAEEAKPIVDTLMKGGKIERGYLGVGIQPVTDDIAAALGLPKNRGEIVARVEPDGPASQARLKPGTVIVRVNGKHGTHHHPPTSRAANHQPGPRTPTARTRGSRPH